MAAYIFRRLLLVIPTLFGILLVNFALVQFVPGGPVEQIIAQLEGGGDVFEGFAGVFLHRPYHQMPVAAISAVYGWALAKTDRMAFENACSAAGVDADGPGCELAVSAAHARCARHAGVDQPGDVRADEDAASAAGDGAERELGEQQGGAVQSAAFEALGLEHDELPGPGRAMVVEWSELWADPPASALRLELSRDPEDSDTRGLVARAEAGRGTAILDAWLGAIG